MRPIAYLFVLLSLSIGFVPQVNAQQIAQQLTCAQVRADFAAKGVIYKSVNGRVLPIRQGIPIDRARSLFCGRQSSRFTNSTPTLDNPRCVFSAYCR